jgi:archaellum component FlaC
MKQSDNMTFGTKKVKSEF